MAAVIRGRCRYLEGEREGGREGEREGGRKDWCGDRIV